MRVVKRQHIVYACIALMLLSGPVAADLFAKTYDFATDPSDYWVFYQQRFVSNAYTTDDTWNIWEGESTPYLQLVKDGTTNAMGQAWLNTPLPGAYFDISFRWQPTRSATGLDGFTFGWVEAIDPGLGNYGGCMGAYRGEGKTNPGYRGYFVEVDFHYNPECDPEAYHFGIMKSGPNTEDMAKIGDTPTFASDEFKQNNWYRMRIRGDYVASDQSRLIEMWVDTTDGQGYSVYNWDDDNPTYTWTIANHSMPDYVYYGFTSGTGGKSGSFLVDDVDILATPGPSSLLIFAAGLGTLKAMRNRRRISV